MIVRPERPLRVARALPPPPVALQRRRQAGGDEQQQRRRRCRRRGHALEIRRLCAGQCLVPSRSRARTRRARRWRGRTTRIFRRVAPAAAAHAAACRGRVRLRARRRRHRRRRRRRPPASGRRGCALAAAAARRGRRQSRANASGTSRDDLILVALGHSIRSLDLPLSLFDDLLSAFGQDTMTTRYASWARRARLLPPLGESGRPARAAHRRLSRRRARSIVGRAVHGAAADELLAGLRPRLARRPAVRAARRDAARAARARPIWAAASLTPAWARALERLRRRDARRVSTRAVRVCDGVAGRLRFELRLTWLGGRRILERVDRRTRRSAAAPADARRGATSPRARSGAPRAGGRGRLMARKTSFYYAFLVLPAEQRRAIIAVWDFCRAVDDAVDESRTSARDAGVRARRSLLARGAGALLRRRRAGDAAGPQLAAVHRARSTCRARRSRTSSTAWRWTSIRRATRPSTTCSNTAGASRRRSA